MNTLFFILTSFYYKKDVTLFIIVPNSTLRFDLGSQNLLYPFRVHNNIEYNQGRIFTFLPSGGEFAICWYIKDDR